MERSQQPDVAMDTTTAGALIQAGVIEEVYCENFMSHSQVRIQLSPQINFLTGANGSGKSAIVAAIQVGLGSSTHISFPEEALGNLIRGGHQGNALVRITLRNEGSEMEPFRQEIYGKKIIVERLLYGDGSTECRLKDQRGVVQSTLTDDLDTMLGHLMIETDNPSAIFNVKMAEFLRNGNPSAMYAIFAKLVELTQMRTTFNKIRGCLQDEYSTHDSKQHGAKNAIRRADSADVSGGEFGGLVLDVGQNIQYLKTTFELVRAMLDTHTHVQRKTIASYVSLRFNYYMDQYGFAGRLTFCHGDQRLEIPLLRNDAPRMKWQTLGELSVGERSCAYLALLLALGDTVECPFRVLDGFDLGMDAKNRDLTIQLLVDYAKSHQGTQFIFVTSHDIANSPLLLDQTIKITKLDSLRANLDASMAA